MFQGFPSIVASGLLVAIISAPASAQGVGSVGAANQDAKGAPPGAASRMLGVGQSVVHNERIVTDAQGSAQISFTDGSSMAVGHNSSVVVNNYAYNPASGAGAQGASLLKGAMRFVGGQVSHGQGMTVNTPSATIGVRGGVATFVVEPPGRDHRHRVRVIIHYGTLTVDNAGGHFVTSVPEFEVIIDGPNSAPLGHGVADPIDLANIGRQMTSHGRQHGGSRHSPTDGMMTVNGVRTPRPGTTPGDPDMFARGDDVARTRGAPTLEKYIPGGISCTFCGGGP